MGAFPLMSVEPQRFGHADRLNRQGCRDGGAVAPERRGRSQVEFQQTGHAGAVAGHGHGATVAGAQSREVIKRLRQRLHRSIQIEPLQRPGPAAADGSDQPFAIPGRGAHPIDPLGHGRFGSHRPGPLPSGVGAGLEHQVPPTRAVLRHKQLPVGQPLGLKHRDAVTSGQLTGPEQPARVAELRAPETAAVPGHGGLLPLHPGEALAIGAQAAIAGKVRRSVQ